MVQPATRRLIIYALAMLAGLSVLSEVALAFMDKETSDALMAVASACVGGIAGMTVPHAE